MIEAAPLAELKTTMDKVEKGMQEMPGNFARELKDVLGVPGAKADAKGKFFPQMRERLKSRGHKIADYDVCL